MRPLRPAFSLLAVYSFPIFAACTSGGTQLRAGQSPLVVSETPLCRVMLSKVSYDDPSTDDAEFMELRVERLPAPGTAGSTTPEAGASTGCGAGTSTSGGADAAPSSALTLGDCGLSTIDLLNGSSDTCAPYRTLSMETVVVPPDDAILVCSADSTLAASTHCDVTMAGSSKLPNGWLQNGPSDGFRFAGSRGTSAEISYGGINATCFQGTPVSLVEETGQSADGADDVNVACGSEFRLVSATTLTPRVPAFCDSPPDAASVSPVGAASGGQGGATTLDVAVGAAGSFGETTQVLQQTAPASLRDGGGADASGTQRSRLQQPPQPSGCSAARWAPIGTANPVSTLATLFIACLVLRCTRRRAPAAVLR